MRESPYYSLYDIQLTGYMTEYFALGRGHRNVLFSSLGNKNLVNRKRWINIKNSLLPEEISSYFYSFCKLNSYPPVLSELLYSG